MSVARTPNATMRGPIDEKEFLRNPLGSFVVSRCWLYFCAHADFSGCFLWGRPEADEVARLAAVSRAARTHPHPMLIDCRLVVGLQAGVFDRTVELTQAAGISIAPTKLAILRPEGGLMGAITAGFFAVVPGLARVQLFTELEPALGWLERTTDASLVRDLALRAACEQSAPRLLQKLRTELENDLRLSVSEAASRIGVSSRSLQRHLAHSKTTFTDEVALAKVRVAMAMLRDPTASITEVAYAVGCSSLQGFSTLFRRRTGKTPSGWRTSSAATIRVA